MVRHLGSTDLNISFSGAVLTPICRADTEDSWQKDVDQLMKYASMSNYTDLIRAVTVGSESRYRNQHDVTSGLTADVLSQRIDKTKAALATAILGDKYLLGTADSWNIFQDGTANPVIRNKNTTLLLDWHLYTTNHN